jgi:hypothetical protein
VKRVCQEDEEESAGAMRWDLKLAVDLAHKNCSFVDLLAMALGGVNGSSILLLTHARDERPRGNHR